MYFKNKISCVGDGFRIYFDDYGKFQLLHIKKEILFIQNGLILVIFIEFNEIIYNQGDVDVLCVFVIHKRHMVVLGSYMNTP